MSPKTTDSAEEILNDPSGGTAQLRKMGLTDFAIVTYVVRVQQGTSKESALRELVEGRSFSEGQVQFVRMVLEQFRIR